MARKFSPPAPAPEEAARRVPTQERAKQRARRILDAAAYVFAEDGLDGATMEAIAARAETSIGSIYQFFPNKLAIFDALARHYHAQLRAFFDALLDGPLLDRPWPEILDSGIDALVLFHEQEPGFRAVWVGLQLTPLVITEGEAINREFAKRIEAVLAAKLAPLPSHRRAVVASMIVEIMQTMLIVSVRRPAEAAGFLAETKLLLKRYLAPYEDDATPSVRVAQPAARAAQPAARKAKPAATAAARATAKKGSPGKSSERRRAAVRSHR